MLLFFQDKLSRRHTAGLFVTCKCCGIVVQIDEIAGSKTISQTLGCICELVSQMTEESRRKLKIWMYDDICHLAPHAENCKDSTETTKFFAELPKAVDNFHHKNHLKSDKYCQENTNPKIELKKFGIDKVNSQACE